MILNAALLKKKTYEELFGEELMETYLWALGKTNKGTLVIDGVRNPFETQANILRVLIDQNLNI